MSAPPEPYLSSLIFRRGLRANHHTLAMVASTPTAAAGFTILRERSDIPATLPSRTVPSNAGLNFEDSSVTHMSSILFP